MRLITLALAALATTAATSLAACDRQDQVSHPCDTKSSAGNRMTLKSQNDVPITEPAPTDGGTVETNTVTTTNTTTC